MRVHVTKRNRRRIIASSVIGVIVLILGLGILRISTDSPSTQSREQVTPPFQALLPVNTPVNKLGGWQKLTPPDGSSVYVFIDRVDGVSVNVSQQILPDTFKQDTASKVAELAKAYNATRVLEVETTKAYIGTSAKGPQSVLFTKNGLLIFIKSDGTISDDMWEKYISRLV